jgi:hypothetical protein
VAASTWPPPAYQSRAARLVRVVWVFVVQCSLGECTVRTVCKLCLFGFLATLKEPMSRIADLQGGQIIGSWCDSEIRLALGQMDTTDLAAIEDRRRRSYGRTPFDGAGTGSPLDLSRFLKDV